MDGKSPLPGALALLRSGGGFAPVGPVRFGSAALAHRSLRHAPAARVRCAYLALVACCANGSPQFSWRKIQAVGLARFRG